MEITAIETKTFEQMQQAFERFANRVKSLCYSNKNEQWLSNNDVCVLLKISKRTLQHYRDTGMLPFSQIGYKCYYRTSDVEQFINQQIKNQ